ncbi:MAG: AAC(3) family N-acetyltransferase [Halobacteriales archaeon]|nr:AAC(3) family N-acetyltransferase [Halobacteriales archaeon]
MTEELVERVDRPVTPDRITDDLRALGIERDDTLFVHSSLSALGWVPGGAQGAVEGIRAAVPDGTVVVPTHSTDLSEPSGWENPPVPESWYGPIRESIPAYRPDSTPTRGMGAIADCLRSYDAAVRSDHPLYSVTALGADAEEIVADHPLEDGMGPDSPLATVRDLNGRILMLGCDWGRNTSLHLAEHHADIDQLRVEAGAPIAVDGEQEWVTFTEPDYDDSDFAACGEAFLDAHPESATTGGVGEAVAVLFDQPALLEFATAWLAETR